jgi:hypothetical protein
MKEKTYLAPRRYHHGMVRQCLRDHDGTKPGEDADDTSARHSTHQHQISSGERPSSSRRSSRSPWPKPSVWEVTEPRAQGGNQQDLTDRQVRHREIYRAHPISTASSGGSSRDQARRRRWRLSHESSGERKGEGERADWTGRERPSHLVGLDQVGWCRQVGQGTDKWARSNR